ncbi:hypothetical protein TARUN_7152 [Trichoderma arundinaceum]|uniref:Uncharacterized protein n=1 Tax=Trichoderma arundinaceum TaxID=490622 RepID=A0A395NGX5_TRIAR|nr:hypothetical protein TARUN_7152 [Trichoderma arundinaceum]
MNEQKTINTKLEKREDKEGKQTLDTEKGEVQSEQIKLLKRPQRNKAQAAAKQENKMKQAVSTEKKEKQRESIKVVGKKEKGNAQTVQEEEKKIEGEQASPTTEEENMKFEVIQRSIKAASTISEAPELLLPEVSKPIEGKNQLLQQVTEGKEIFEWEKLPTLLKHWRYQTPNTTGESRNPEMCIDFTNIENANRNQGTIADASLLKFPGQTVRQKTKRNDMLDWGMLSAHDPNREYQEAIAIGERPSVKKSTVRIDFVGIEYADREEKTMKDALLFDFAAKFALPDNIKSESLKFVITDTIEVDINDPESVWRLITLPAKKYERKGFHLFSKGGKTLNADNCCKTVVDDHSYIIVLRRSFNGDSSRNKERRKKPKVGNSVDVDIQEKDRGYDALFSTSPK